MKFILFIGGLFLVFTSPALAAEEWKCKFLYGFQKNADQEIQEIPNMDQLAHFSIKDRKLAIVNEARGKFPLIFDYGIEGNGARVYNLFYTNMALVIQLSGEYKLGSSANMRIIENSDDDLLVVENFECVRDF